MSRVRILIIEDEMIIAEDMRDMLEELGYEVVGVAGSDAEARRLLLNISPDLVLVDITLGVEQTGLELGKYIDQQFDIPFIFCTSHADTATLDQAKKANPNGYLVKPFDQKDLYSSIEIALSNYSKSIGQNNESSNDDLNDGLVIKDALFIKSGQLFVKVKFNDILWLSPDGNYTILHVRDNKKHLVRVPLKDILIDLPETQFYRTHRSYIVNLEHVDSINNQYVYIGEAEIPLGKNFRDELLSRINKMT